MGALSATQPGYLFTRFQENANRLFEAQLECIGLAQSQIEQQSLTELEDSLVRVDNALSFAASFAVLRLSMTASAGVDPLITYTSSQTEMNVVPLLLRREKIIIDRIRLLRGQHTLKTLPELIDSVTDQRLQEQLRTDFETSRQTGFAGKTEVRPDYAFVVMPMDPQNRHLEDLSDAIKEGASRCGISAERIDDTPCNEPITVRILSAIKEAGFVLVVLTYARDNVYYEAGYAQGIGKTPVFVAEEGTPIPFDLKDYPIIFYSNMRELKASLAERLTSMRSSGPHKD